jgi:ribosomal subunit interface protein
MNINIKAHNIELTDPIRTYALNQVKGLETLLGEDAAGSLVGQIELGKDGNHHKTGDVFKAEFKISAGKHTFFATSQKDSLYAAIDKAGNDIVNDAKKTKGRERSLIRRGGSKVKSFVKNFFKRDAQ